MKTTIAILAALLLLTSGQAFALDGKMSLAKRYIELAPVSTSIEQALTAMFDPQHSGSNRAKIAAILKRIDAVSIQSAYLRALTNTFTEKELQAMIAFYSSREGKSVLIKMPAVMNQISPIIFEQLLKAVSEDWQGVTNGEQ